ncbi:MAG TPA: mechanosensitive ion channel domain-containing protein [Methylibium sp.]
MTHHPINREELRSLVESLLKPTAFTELLVLAVCLALAWTVARLLRGTQARPRSIWFGYRIFDGVLFPVLSLVFAFVARDLLSGMVPIAVFRLALPILMSLLVIRLFVRVMTAAFPNAQVMRVVERSVSWVVWIGVVLWFTGVLPTVLEELDGITWKMGASTISLRNVVEGSLSVVVALVLVLWMSSAIEARLLKDATHENLSVRKITANAVRALLVFVGMLFALSAAGIDLTALSVLGGAIGVGLGFGLQKLAANYVSGFVVLAERSLRIGDLIKVDNFEGRITDIKTRYTVIRSAGGRESIVPNEMLITQRVENASLTDTKVLMSTVVQVAYGTDVRDISAKLQAAATRVPRVMGDPGPSVHLTAFAPDGLELTVWFWIPDPENGQSNVRSAVNLAILETLNAEGIDIPYPQRVVRQIVDAVRS